MHARPVRNRYLLLVDGILLVAAIPAAYLLRFTGLHWGAQAHVALVFGLIVVPAKLAILYLAGAYRRLWRHASMPELVAITRGAALAGVASVLLGGLVLPWTGLTTQRVPLSVLALDVLFGLVVVAGPRLWLRVSATQHPQRRRRTDDPRALIAGAGSAGQMIAKELLANPQLGLVPVGFVDDDHAKHGHRLLNLPVFGALSSTGEVVGRERIAEVIIAMPAASGSVVRAVVQAARDAGARTRTVPGLSEIISGRVGISSLREVRIDDLLRREPIRTDLEQVRTLVHGHTVLVTGAGGSIGSELCRQLAELSPWRLVLLGHGENSIFDILHELEQAYPELRLNPVIADVRDTERIRALFRHYRPHAVFHAAAHKHVPLMEENAVEAVTNNILGTRNVVNAAGEVGTRHFVLISTDKAVHPTSIMGATKRGAELAVQHAAARYGRNYVAVRFGNVLGSRGSVVPIFLRQIRAGGPVTITHPDMCRYFMTIPEAVQLVLQAGAMGSGGEVFVLDMGEPVKIMDLAADLIRLSGLKVGADVEIRCTGIRPGEKLYEEMFFDGEHALPTEHLKVLRARHADLATGATEHLGELVVAAQRGCTDKELRLRLAALVSDFTGVEPDTATPADGVTEVEERLKVVGM